jgi:hypothetical protein
MKVTIIDKNDYVARIYPQISDEGQEYLKNIAQAMLSIQNQAGGDSPVPNDPGKDGKEAAE